MRHLTRLLVATVAVIGASAVPAAAAVAAPSRASTGAADTGLLGPLSAQWWVWDFESPNIPADPVTDLNPGTALDPAPVNCALGQSGPVWYLAGTNSITQSYNTAYRSCTVPEGKFLFFPLYDAWADNSECPPTAPDAFTADQLLGFAQASTRTVSSISATVDGFAVPGLRPTPTSVFHASATGIYYMFGVHNWLSLACSSPPGFPAGFTTPAPGASADGFYLLVPPLPPGVHVLHWTASTGTPATTAQDITYRIRVTRG